MPFFDPIRIGASGAVAADYTVDRSLRFNYDDTGYLNRTSGTSTSQYKFTYSVWLKLGRAAEATSNYGELFNGYDGNNNNSGFGAIYFYNGQLRFAGWSGSHRATNRIFRDPSAWYHIVVAVDTTLSTADNRQKIYINGVEETSFSSSNNLSQNSTFGIGNNSAVLQIGRDNSASSDRAFDGYMSEINYIDGQQLTPSSFGETNADTGQWVPINTSGLTFGTNGFRLQFADNSGTTATTLGKDTSGNSNNFTPNNFSVSAGAGNDSVEDTPTNNFPTFNPLCENNDHTYSEGNLKVTYAANNQSGNVTSMASPKTGKWYWEVRPLNDYLFIGVTADTYLGTGNVVNVANTVAYYSSGDKYVGGSSSTYNNQSFTNGDVIGVALDMDNGQVTFYKNNTSQGAISLVSTEGHLGIGAVGTGQSLSMSINFGQQAFSYTPPTGFVSLCSANLPDPTILLPNEHFNTLLWSGNGAASRAITGLNFQPDWVWLKSRTNTDYHQTHDSVRGIPAGVLFVNESATEDSNYPLDSFDSNGFTTSADASDQQNTNGQNYVAWNWNAGDTDGKTYTVTVVDDSGNKYRFDGFGTSAVTLDLAEGGTYIFNYPSAHPLKFSTTADGTHGGGSEYTTGVTHNSSTQVTIVVAASAPTLYYYCSIHSGMGGQVNTNSTLGSSNFDGSIQTTVKVNATAGFSIVAYEGNGSNGSTIGHGLGVTPNHVIWKNRSSAGNWQNWQTQLGDNAVLLNLTNSQISASGNNLFTYSDFNSTTLKLGPASQTNGNNHDMIAYCFSEVAGYSKFGSYTGNGSSDGTFVFTGFRPAWVLVKNIDTAYSWDMFDNKRDPDNVCTQVLAANLTDADTTVSSCVDFLSNGFKFRNNHNSQNRNGDTFIYLAFAESPFKNARAR